MKSVSALSPELKEKNTLQFAMKTRLKLFWRPSQLKEADALVPTVTDRIDRAVTTSIAGEI